MRLSALSEQLSLVLPLPPHDMDIDIKGLTLDSRRVEPGFLFAALSGSRQNGIQFARQAVAAGAAAVLGDVELQSQRLPVPTLVSDDPPALLAKLAAKFFGQQPAMVAAVTGTNGKTSVASFTRQLWALSGKAAASIGTLGVQSTTGDQPGSLTTPDSITLQRLAAELAANGVEHLVIEASSHGLEQKRVDGLTIAAAAFTNLTRDHLDHHGSMEAYLAAKRRLFGEVLTVAGCAVLNADAPAFDDLRQTCIKRGIEFFDYGRNARMLRLESQRPQAIGQVLDLRLNGSGYRVETSLVGEFQAMNLLASLGLWHATGGSLEEGVELLGRVEGAPGRMQLAGATTAGAAVYVDYAHTPDALDQALRALRPHTNGKLKVVFGCGGDRDPGKRVLMGEIASALTDDAIVTDDNPRGEDPAAIRAAALAGMRENAREIGGRAEAIRTAVGELGAGDLLLIAGKGHEQGQIIKGTVHPFDDLAVAKAALACCASR